LEQLGTKPPASKKESESDESSDESSSEESSESSSESDEVGKKVSTKTPKKADTKPPKKVVETKTPKKVEQSNLDLLLSLEENVPTMSSPQVSVNKNNTFWKKNLYIILENLSTYFQT
jgi:hypothetical protein